MVSRLKNSIGRCELPILLALSKSRRDGEAARDTSLVLNQVSEEKGVTIRANATAKQRQIAVANLVKRVFEKESYVKQVAAGLAHWLCLDSTGKSLHQLPSTNTKAQV